MEQGSFFNWRKEFMRKSRTHGFKIYRQLKVQGMKLKFVASLIRTVQQ